MARCVRRAFLCGEDHLTGKNYTHRKQWAVERLALLSRVFAIDVASYAIMSNHYHLVLRVDKHRASTWDERSVAVRWGQLYTWPLPVEKYMSKNANEVETAKAKHILQQWRERLHDLSWFMRCLNEHLARRANDEDQCRGRFWEGRFKSQALLDEAAVLTCMSYVDLNPVRARLASTLERADYTSVQQRLQKKRQTSRHSTPQKHPSSQVKLMALVKSKRAPHPNALGCTLSEYLALVRWVAQCAQDEVQGTPPPILQRFGMDKTHFLEYVLTHTDHTFYPCASGPLRRLKALARHWKQRFIKGQNWCDKLYQSGVLC